MEAPLTIRKNIAELMGMSSKVRAWRSRTACWNGVYTVAQSRNCNGAFL